MIPYDATRLPERDLRPPEPTGCVDCGGALDEGECPPCEEERADRREQERIARRRAWLLRRQNEDYSDGAAKDDRRSA